MGGSRSVSSGIGIGGSMARFTIVGDHLYTVDAYNLNTFDISSRCNEQCLVGLVIEAKS